MRVRKADEATKRRLANYAPRNLEMKRDPDAPGVWISKRKTAFTGQESQTTDWQEFVKAQLTGVTDKARAAKAKRRGEQ